MSTTVLDPVITTVIDRVEAEDRIGDPLFSDPVDMVALRGSSSNNTYAFIVDIGWHRVIYGKTKSSNTVWEYLKSIGSFGTSNTEAKFRYPTAIASDIINNNNDRYVYVADSWNNQVVQLLFSPSSQMMTFVRNITGFQYPRDVDVHNNGTKTNGSDDWLWVLDYSGKSIYEINNDGTERAHHSSYRNSSGSLVPFRYPKKFSIKQTSHGNDQNVIYVLEDNGKTVLGLSIDAPDGYLQEIFSYSFSEGTSIINIESDEQGDILLVEYDNHLFHKLSSQGEYFCSYGGYSLDIDGFKYPQVVTNIRGKNITVIGEGWSDNSGGKVYYSGADVVNMSAYDAGNLNVNISYILTNKSDVTTRIHNQSNNEFVADIIYPEETHNSGIQNHNVILPYYGNFELQVIAQPSGSGSLNEEEALHILSFTVNISQAPQNPSTEAGVMSIDLSWDQIPGVSQYKVYRATSSGGSYNLVKTVSSNSTSDEVPDYNTTYYYKVRGYVPGIQLGPFSDVVSAQALHMASRSANATAHNNGHKIVLYETESENILHLLFIDNNAIYHTFSSDRGQTWNEEVLVGDNVAQFKNPSVAINPTDGKPYVVYEKIVNTDNHLLKLKRFYNSAWNDYGDLPYEGVNNVDMRPSIHFRDNGYFYVVFKGSIHDSSPDGIRLLVNKGGDTYYPQNVDRSNSNSKNPSCVTIEGGEFDPDKIHVIWEENDEIYTTWSSLVHDEPTNWRYWQSLSSDYPGPLWHRNPSSATDGYNIYVAWETREWVEKVCPVPRLKTTAAGCGSYRNGIYVRRKGLSGWNYPLQKFMHGSTSTKYPVLSLSPSSTANDTEGALVYQTGSSIYFNELNNNGWIPAVNLGSPGTYPTVAAGSNGNYVIYPKGSSPPYTLEVVSPTLLTKMSVDVSESNDSYLQYWREVNMDLSQMHWGHIQPGDITGSVQIALSQVEAYTANGVVPLQYDLVDEDSSNWRSDWFVTQPFLVNNDVHSISFNLVVYTYDLTFPQASNSLNNRPLISVWLNTPKNEDHRVKKLHTVLFGDLPESADTMATLVIPVLVDVKQWNGQSFYLSTDLVGKSEKIPHYYAEVYFYPDSADTVWGNQPRVPAVTDTFPNAFSISDNFPNPFNPITTIQYFLPEEAMVKLKVYDILGREIRTLINGIESAGYKKVQWDGKDKSEDPVSSGMFIYRFNVKLLDSNKQFTRSQKMVLLR